MNPRTGPRRLTPLCACVLSAAACGRQPPAEPATTGPAQAPGPAQPVPGDPATAEDLLKALERADESLVSLTADIRYDRTFELQGDRQVRTGRLYFVSGGKPVAEGAPPTDRRFAVTFKDLLVGDTFREEPKSYTFDGQWLVEKYPKEKPPLFIKRQVVPPGQKFDPLRVGEGPFPLPIGQKAADITNRFAVELLPPGAGLDARDDADPTDRATADKLKEFVAGAPHLKLTPKPQFAPDEEFSEIHLWYRRDKAGTLLPRMARTLDKQGNVSIIQLINVAQQRAGEPKNEAAAVPPDVLDTQPPPPEAGWNVETIPWQKPAHAAGGPPSKKEGADAGDP